MMKSVPLYILNLQKEYSSYTEALVQLDEKQILTVEELLKEEEKNILV